MKKASILIFAVLLTCQVGFAQDMRIFGDKNGDTRNIDKEIVPTLMFQATYAALFTGLDTRADFGFTNTVGGSVIYKTANNWLFTANGNLIFGNQLKKSRTDILGMGITNSDGDITGGAGIPVALAFFQRGLLFQAEAGKLFAFKPNPNSGFFVQCGLGYLRNRIRIEYQIEAQNPPQPLMNDYQYGYDQMRGGMSLHGEFGYLLMSNSRLYNLSIALECTYARTRHLRDYDFRVYYDESGNPQIVGYNDKNQRFNELYYGIRVSWMFPTYERQPDAYYYY